MITYLETMIKASLSLFLLYIITRIAGPVFVPDAHPQENTQNNSSSYYFDLVSWRSVHNYASVLVDDIDEDRRDEFLFWEGDTEKGFRITYYDEEVKHIGPEIGYFYSNLYIHTMNWDSKYDKEIVISYRGGDKAYLCLKSSEGEDVVIPFEAFEGLDHNNNGFWDGSIRPQIDYDINKDGFKDIICTVVSHHDGVPRGIYAFDLKNKGTLWSHPTGTKPENLLLRDVNNDTIPEIICSSYAPGNGVSENGTDDFHSYCIILTIKGELYWQIETGGVKSGCHIVAENIENEDKIDIIIASYTKSKSSEDIQQDAKLSSLNGELKSSNFPDLNLKHNPLALIAENITDDTKKEVVLGTQDGLFLVYDHKFNLLKKREFPHQIDFIIINNLDNDDGDSKEIIVSSENPKDPATVLNTRLENIVQYESGGIPFLLKQEPNIPNRLLLLAPEDELTLLTLRKKDEGIQTVPLSPLQRYWPYGLSILLLLLLLMVIGIRTSQPSPLFSGLKDESFDDLSNGLILMDKKGSIVNMNEATETVLGLKRNLTIGSNYLDTFQTNALSGLREFIAEALSSSEFKGTSRKLEIQSGDDKKTMLVDIHPLSDSKSRTVGLLLTFQDRTGLTRTQRIATWGVLAQRLAHSIKNSLNTMRLALQRMESVSRKTMGDEATGLDKYIAANQEEIVNLLKMTDELMRISDLKPPNFQPTKINAIIEKVLAKHAEPLSSMYTLNLDVAEDLPEVRADGAWIEAVIDNLLTNAFSAMGREGTINISAIYAQRFQDDSESIGEKEYVQVEISDTGCGIPAGDIEKIFDPFFTDSQGGTGLGLAIVKKYVEEHNGIIEVKSREGVGTTFAICIPVWKR